MNQDANSFDRVDDELKDTWLTNNLKLTQLEPTKDFTKKVVKKATVKPSQTEESPLFWILIITSGIFLIWIVLFSLSAVGDSYITGLIPNVSKYISLYKLSKYVIMISLSGLFFIGLDRLLSKKFSIHKLLHSFFVV
jgi:hypothetical protein